MTSPTGSRTVLTQTLSTPPIVTEGDLGGNAASFALHLRAANKAPRTQATYMEAIRGFARYLEAQGMPRNVASIRREHVEAWIVHLLETSKTATAANRFRSLQQFWKWAVEEGEITVSPMSKMKPPTILDEAAPVLTDAQLRALISACEGPDFDERRDMAIIRTFVGSGIRLAELTGLTANDVDLVAQELDVMGKGRRPRRVEVGAKAARAIDRYLRVRGRHAHHDSPSLWLGERGGMTVSGIAQLIRRRGDQAGIIGLHPHLLRHSWAHGVLAADMGDGNIMALAGWKDPGMLRRYARATAADRAIAASRRLNPADRL